MSINIRSHIITSSKSTFLWASKKLHLPLLSFSNRLQPSEIGCRLTGMKLHQSLIETRVGIKFPRGKETQQDEIDSSLALSLYFYRFHLRLSVTSEVFPDFRGPESCEERSALCEKERERNRRGEENQKKSAMVQKREEGQVRRREREGERERKSMTVGERRWDERRGVNRQMRLWKEKRIEEGERQRECEWSINLPGSLHLSKQKKEDEATERNVEKIVRRQKNECNRTL